MSYKAVAGCEIRAVFHQDKTEAYVLEFTLNPGQGAKPLDVMTAALELAKLCEGPRFDPLEQEAVNVALNQALA